MKKCKDVEGKDTRSAHESLIHLIDGFEFHDNEISKFEEHMQNYWDLVAMSELLETTLFRNTKAALKIIQEYGQYFDSWLLSSRIEFNINKLKTY